MISFRRRTPLLAALLALPILAATAWAQPRISYAIPDIGAPGMSTYVELVAPQSSPNTFPFSGLLGSGSIVVEPAIAADSSRIVVSPVVVSWDGRLIGCHVFVRPGALTGTVPLRARWGATTTNSVDFTIVTPQSFGEKSGGGVIGSGGSMGTRSARGAMIVDSMVLRSGAYSFSTADADGATNGSQGYLPVIVLSRGRIVVATDATLSVDAGGKHGGPGGGGGGGYGPTRPQSGLIPAIPGELDAPQGDGFAGGKSAVPFVPSPGPFGNGTGADSRSLNGVETNASFRTGAASIRLYGSGPGHPFDSDGRSGGAAAIAAAAPPAIFGTRFGGGGNATAGSGITDLTDLNGQVVGNRHLVPLHGGAGGAGGGSNDSIGGGGGGAVALYAATSASIAHVSAVGARGRQGCNGCGTGSGDPSGGGAGGGIIVGARGRVEITTVDVAGGAGGTAAGSSTAIAGSGGVGRFRHDGRAIGAPSVTASASRYVGPTLDTLSYVDSLHRTVSGTGRPGDDIVLFVRGDVGPWPATPLSTTVGSDSTWRIRARFPVDTLAFVVALQRTPTAETSTGAYTFTPSHAFSQAAAAVVRVSLFARIVAPPRRALDSVLCPDVRFDTIVVRNTGTAPLALGAGSSFIGANASLFSIVSPSLPDSVAPGDSVRVIVRFDGRTTRNGQLGATLRLVTNDRDAATFDIAFGVVKEDRSFTVTPLFFDLGDLYVGTLRDSIAIYRNANSYRDTITSITAVSGALGVITLLGPALPSIQSPGGSRDIVFRFAPVDTGRFVARYRISTRPCGRDTTITVTGHARSAVIDSRTSITFAALGCADSATERLVVRNRGNAPMILHYPTLSGSDASSFEIVAPPSAGFPRTVAIGDSVAFDVRAVNSSTAPRSASLVFMSNDSLRGKNPWIVALDGSRDPLVIEPADTTIDFGTICVGDAATRAAVVANRSQRTPAGIVAIERANPAAPFPLIPQPPVPTTVGARDSLLVPIVFTPDRAGAFADTITLRVAPCGRALRVIVRGVAVDRSPTLSTGAVDFGDVRVGDVAVDTIVVTSTRPAGAPPIVVDRVVLTGAATDVTIIWPQPPVARSLAAGDTMHVIVRYAPTAGGVTLRDSLLVGSSGLCVSSASIALSGRGVTSAVVVTRGALALRSGPCSSPGPVEDTVSVINRGSAPLEVTSITATPSAFTVVTPTTPLTLAPGSAATVRVRFLSVAASATPLVGTLTIRSTDTERPSLSVALSGRRDTAAIASDRALVDFGSVLSCEPRPAQALTLRNDGTLTDTIRVATPPGFALEPPAPYRLAPGADTVVLVRFVAATMGATSQTLVGTGACNTAVVVELRGESEAPALVARSVDFGEVAVGSSARRAVIVENPHRATMRIAAARVVGTGTEVSVTPGQLPVTIPPGGTASLAVEFAPGTAADIPPAALIELTIDSSCSLRLEAPLGGRGISGGLALSHRALDYGSLAWCSASTDSVVVRNVGSRPIAITTVAVIPSPPDAFALLSSPAPATILPGDSLAIGIRFGPASGVDGPRTALLRLESDDPDRPVVEIGLGGARVSESLAIDGPSFGAVAPGAVVTRRFAVVNDGTATMPVTAVTISPPFSVARTRPGLPVTLVPGDTLTVDLEYAPTSAEAWRDSLRIEGSFACAGPFAHPIEAGSVAAIASIDAPELEATPGERLSMPLVLSGGSGLDEAGARALTAYVRFNRTVLLPAGSTPLGVVVGNERHVALRGLRAAGQSDGPVATLEAIAALGDTLATAITIDSVRFDDALVAVSLSAGSVRIRPSGGWRLFLTTGRLRLIPRPNPLGNDAVIEYETIESERTIIDLVDVRGRLVATLLDAETAAGSWALPLDTRGLAAGRYLLRLRTRADQLTVPVVIVH